LVIVDSESGGIMVVVVRDDEDNVEDDDCVDVHDIVSDEEVMS